MCDIVLQWYITIIHVHVHRWGGEIYRKPILHLIYVAVFSYHRGGTILLHSKDILSMLELIYDYI